MLHRPSIDGWQKREYTSGVPMSIPLGVFVMSEDKETANAVEDDAEESTEDDTEAVDAEVAEDDA